MMKSDSAAQSLIVREDSALVVIDVQERLMPVIDNSEAVTANVVRLLKFAKIIGLPVILTEQQKLGSTVDEVKTQIPDLRPIAKLTFDCFLCDQFEDMVHRLRRNTLILTGVETHVCVAQTAVHALAQFTVHVVSDATGSRTVDNWSVGLERMRDAGGVITSTEMAIFELLQQAGTDEFRAVLPLVK